MWIRSGVSVYPLKRHLKNLGLDSNAGEFLACLTACFCLSLDRHGTLTAKSSNSGLL
jgi:hypothetical protein